MSVSVPIPQKMTRYIDADGRLTTEGLILLLKLVEAKEDHEARLVAGGL